MPVPIGNEIGLAFVTGYRIDQEGNQYAVFYLGNVHENGYVYFNDEYMYRCEIDGTSLQILNLPSHIWCLSGVIQDLSITTIAMKNLLSILKGGISIAGTGVEAAVNWAVEIAKDDSHGYSWGNRQGPDYDCSSLVSNAFYNAGFDINPNNTTYTMVQDFTSAGFEWLTGSEYTVSTENLQRGDIVLFVGDPGSGTGHTELYIGDNQTVGAHWCEGTDPYNAIPGDQTGDEISVQGCYYGWWDGILRWTHGNSVTPPNNS